MEKRVLLSRRDFLLATAGTSAALAFGIRRTLGEFVSPVKIIREAAATAKINVTRLRGNVSVLEGSGGNIAVLTGKDGKVLVDAGITASRAAISRALASLSPDPITH